MKTPYKICAICGAHLDPGEVCDCKRNRKAPERAVIYPEQDTYGRSDRVITPAPTYAEIR